MDKEIWWWIYWQLTNYVEIHLLYTICKNIDTSEINYLKKKGSSIVCEIIDLDQKNKEGI